MCTVLPTIVVITRGFSLTDTSSIGWTVAYILGTAICMFILIYIVARDDLTIFLLEKDLTNENDELINTINLFEGGVLIINDQTHEILFKND